MLIELDDILILPSRLSLQDRSGPGKSLPFNKDQIVEGRVIRPIPPHHALLLFGREQVKARTLVPLRAGQIAFFKVKQVKPECVLKLVELRTGDQDGINRLLPGTAFRESPYKILINILASLNRSLKESDVSELPDILSRLWTLINRISLPSKMPHGHFLKSFINGSGMIWEHKLRSFLLSHFQTDHIEALLQQDLKGLALKSLADGMVDKLVSAKAMSRFVDGLEQFQLLNVFGLEEKGKLFFTIPIQLNNEFFWGQLLINLPKKGDDEGADRDRDKVLRASLFLQMSCLGPVRADVSVFQKAIRITFWVCEKEIQPLFNHYTDLLKKQLERHGFYMQEITCHLQEANILTQTSLVEELFDSEEHEINLVV